MKRHLIAAALLLLAGLTACTAKEQDTMTIKPSEFSDETTKVINMLDKNVAFFDFAVDDTVKSYAVNAWIVEDEKWVNNSSIVGDIKSKNQLAIQITDSGYNIYNIDENGYNKLSSPKEGTEIKGSSQQLSTKITSPEKIVIDKEIPLMVKIGNNDTSISIPSDFRDAKCTEGIAFTITFSNKEAE